METTDPFSFCDISSVFVTRTIEQIISPMAVQLCHLIISLECDKPKYDGDCWSIETITDNLSKATEYFANATIRLSGQCDDRSLKEELDKSANSVLVMGKNMLLAVQKLSIQPNVQKHQEELITQAQNILLGTLKILQLEDNADVQKICQAADWVMDCLTFLQTADSMSQLLVCFHEFSEALLLLNCLTERRIMDLKDPVHREHLSGTMKILRKCVSMLYTATKSNLAHKQNEQMVASKQYVFDLATKTVEKLKHLLTNCPTKEVKKRMTFTQQVQHLTRILTNIKPTELTSNDIDFYVGTITFYSMYVADCSRPHVKLRLVKHCQCILDCRKRLLDQLMALQVSSVTNIHMELEKISISVKDELNKLNETLVTAIFYLIQDTFCDVNDPLKILLKASLKTSRKTGMQVQKPSALKTFPLLQQTFHSHTNQLLKVASLVMAHCSEEATFEEIQSSVDHLCKIREDLAVLFVDISKSHRVSKTYEQAQAIYQRWVQATENLLVNFDGMVTVDRFIHLLVKEVEFNSRSCEKLMESKDYESFHKHGTDLCGLVARVIQIVNRYVDRSKDPIFRNGLRVLVRQLEGTWSVTKSVVEKCLESTSRGPTQKLFLEKTKSMFKTLYNVQEGVNGYKHPDLMSPLRTEVLPAPVQKPSFAHFCESVAPPENPTNNYMDYATCLFSYEGYLSKPLPRSSSISYETTSSLNTEDTKHLTDLQPLIDNLTRAIKKLDQKEAYTICSSLTELAKTYIDAANELAALTEVDNSQTVSYKDVEPVASHLVQLSKNVNNNFDLNMAALIHNASFLSHRIEETKKILVSRTTFWYNFSHQLFCSPACNAAQNYQPFCRIVRSLEEIVKLFRNSFSSKGNDQEFTLFSGNRDSLAQIEKGLTRLQATAKYLLTKGCSGGSKTNKAKLEAKCALWSITIQRILKSADEFTDINNLIAPETIDLRKLNIAESKSFAHLCETSLWLQEAALISVASCSKGGERNNIGNLKEQVESLTEAILQSRDLMNMSLVPPISLTAESVLQQRELAVKLKYLMYRLKNIYNGDAIQNVVSLAITLINISDNEKKTVQGIVERDASLLVENIKLTKQILEDTLPPGNHEDLIFLADHLFFLTIHILSRTRAFAESQQCWEVFMLEAMSLNWSAKAQQLFLRLRLYTDLDDTTSAVIKQCLQMKDPPRKQKTRESELRFESDSPQKCVGFVEISVGAQEDFLQSEQKNVTKKNLEPTEKPSNDRVFEPKSLHGDTKGEINVDSFHDVSIEDQSEEQKRSNKSNLDEIVYGASDMSINVNEHNDMSVKDNEDNDISIKDDDEEYKRRHEKTLVALNTDLNGIINNQSNIVPIYEMENSMDLVNQKKEMIFKQKITNEFVETLEQKKEIDRVNVLAKYDTQIIYEGTNQDSPFRNTVLNVDRTVRRNHQKVNEESNLPATEKEVENSLEGLAKQKTELAPEQQNSNEPIGAFNEKPKKENHEDRAMDRSEPQLKLNRVNRVQQNLGIANTQTALNSDRQEKGFKPTIHKETKVDFLGDEPEISLKKPNIKKTEIVQDNKKLNSSMGASRDGPKICNSRQKAQDIPRSQKVSSGVQRNSPFGRTHIPLRNDLQEKIFSLAWTVAKKTEPDSGNEKPPGLRKGKINVKPPEEVTGRTYSTDKCPLEEELETWEGENNTIVQVTREMAMHMSFMIQYLNRKGPLQSADQLIASAKLIASHGQTFVKFVRIMAKNCLDKRSSAELRCGMEQIQTISSQLSIVSSVKAATGCDDTTGADVLVKNAQNLIHSVLQTWKAAEAACLTTTGNPSRNAEETDVAIFCTYLRKKLCGRSKECAFSDV